MRTITWNRDSHGLFDNESKEITKTNLVLGKGNILARRANGEIKVFESEKNLSKDYEALLRVVEVDESKFVY